MERIMQGDAYSVPVRISNGTTVVTPDMVDTVEIIIGNICKRYPGEIGFSDCWMFPLAQQETFRLTPHLQPMQVRVKFVNGEISGVDCGLISVTPSISKEVL